MKIIVFDLDGTLALDEHRVRHLQREPKNWSAYYAAAERDQPNQALIYIYECLTGNLGYSIEIWTGRIESTRSVTEAWIDRHMFCQPDQLRMRPTDSRVDDHEMKKAWYHEELAKGNELLLVFEDRNRVVEMWRAEGITCCQVAPGDF